MIPKIHLQTEYFDSIFQSLRRIRATPGELPIAGVVMWSTLLMIM